MNSEEFIEAHPTINAKIAVRIFNGHQPDDQTKLEFHNEFQTELHADRFDTAKLLGWLGY